MAADFAGLVRGLLVSVAAPLTDSFNEDVMWQHCTGGDGKGGDNYATAVPVRALVERVNSAIRSTDGTLLSFKATLTFVTPLTDVDGRDIFTLPDGATAPITKTGGFNDPLTGQAFVTQVFLGKPEREH